MLTLVRIRLDSNFCIPNSGPLLPSTSRGNWLTRESGLGGHGSQAEYECLATVEDIPYPGVHFRAALVLAGMWWEFTEGISRFLS